MVVSNTKKDGVLNLAMRFPIKINREFFPPWLCNILPSQGDPRKLLIPDLRQDDFEHSISAIKIGDTWKSTRKQRHVLSDKMILEFVNSRKRPSFLEVGASSGSTSLDLLDQLGGNYERYYVTDLSFEIVSVKQKGVTYLYHPVSGQCIMRVTDRFLMYEDVEKALFHFGWIVSKKIADAPPSDSLNHTTINLLHPVLRDLIVSDPRIVVKRHDILEPWPYDTVDVVKVANVLNREYFSTDEIRAILENVKKALKKNGRLIVIDNRDKEMASMYSVDSDGQYVVQNEINGGTAISDIILNM